MLRWFCSAGDEPSQSRIRSTALPRGELFCGAADSVLTLSVTCGDSSPKGGALGIIAAFIALPKPLPLGELARERLRGRPYKQTTGASADAPVV